MRDVLKSGFLWQFVGGFALGAAALVTLHPLASTQASPSTPVAALR